MLPALAIYQIKLYFPHTIYYSEHGEGTIGNDCTL